MLLFAIAPAAVSAQVAPREPISVIGSAAVFPLAEAAGEHYALNSGHEMPVIEPTGTARGIGYFCASNGTRFPDVLATAHRLSRADLGACAQNGVGVSELLIGHQAVALAQNQGPAPLFLTRRQLFLALAREVPVNGRLTANPYRLWSDIDVTLPVKPIVILGPPPGSPLRDALVALVMAPAAAGFPALRGRDPGALREDGAFVRLGEDQGETLRLLAQRANAIGIFDFPYLALHGQGFLSVPIDGVAPSLETIAGGIYAPARAFYLYVKRAHAEVIPGLKDYLGEILSEAAGGPRGYLTARGLVPLPPAQEAAQRAAARSLPPL